ncbi:hypothetical protein [Paenibacillus sp. Marseille-Q4541]|uniref:hypothetical protein n=1 Tax=Paenibacillus sp. Marseille-Q4541 TaxID=2831522 RepID=UPI001BA6051F|nr:hypothetical protein [Paenibacillus sp. Marseille-Q4541]
MKHDHSSLQSSTLVAQASSSVKKLHHAVTQAVSQPTAELVQQAQNRLIHAENAVMAAQQQTTFGGVEFAEEILSEEKERLASLNVSQK